MSDPEVNQYALEQASFWSTGSHGARMLGGNSSFLGELEHDLAKFYNKEAGMVMSSG